MRPGSKAGFGVDVAGFVQIDEIGAPDVRPVLGAPKRHHRIVLARDDQGRDAEATLGHSALRFEPSGLGRSDQHQAGDALVAVGRHAGRGQRAQRMADQYRRTNAGRQQADNGVDPMLDVRLVPAALRDPLEKRGPPLLLALPMFGTAVLEAQNENEVEARREGPEVLDRLARLSSSGSASTAYSAAGPVGPASCHTRVAGQ